jgi:hypothetical protein
MKSLIIRRRFMMNSMDKTEFHRRYKQIFPEYKKIFGKVPNSSDFKVPRATFISALEKAIETKVPVENFIKTKKIPKDSEALIS